MEDKEEEEQVAVVAVKEEEKMAVVVEKEEEVAEEKLKKEELVLIMLINGKWEKKVLVEEIKGMAVTEEVEVAVLFVDETNKEEEGQEDETDGTNEYFFLFPSVFVSYLYFLSFLASPPSVLHMRNACIYKYALFHLRF